METLQTTDKMEATAFREMYVEADDSVLYELLEGEIIKRGAPAIVHQRVSRRLFIAINLFVEKRKAGEVFFAPVDVILDKYNLFQPDIVFVSDAQKQILTSWGIEGAPELIIEIISPGSVLRDRVHKKRVYERNGVKEYWLVSPEYDEIEVFVLKEKSYDLFSAASKTEGKLESEVLKELSLDLKQIFAGDAE